MGVDAHSTAADIRFNLGATRSRRSLFGPVPPTFEVMMSASCGRRLQADWPLPAHLPPFKPA